MLRLEMLPAGKGDALLLEWGSPDEVHRMLIDAGTKASYPAVRQRLLALPADRRSFEAVVITHIDNDHIAGMLPLLQDDALRLQIRDVWYDGWRHIEAIDPDAADAPDVLGVWEGEAFGLLIEERGWSWNGVARGGAITIPDEGDLPVRRLDGGGLEVTFLGPSSAALGGLRTKWVEAHEEVGVVPGDRDAVIAQLRKKKFLPSTGDELGGELDEGLGVDVLGVQDGPPGKDTSEANRSSIAFVARHGDSSALLTGDAHAGDLVAALTRLGHSADDPLEVDLFKLPHHGSWNNVTPELLDLVRAPRYLFSSDGKGTSHPHAKTVELVIEHHRGRRRPELWFNHRSSFTDQWAGEHPLSAQAEVHFPAGSTIVLDG